MDTTQLQGVIQSLQLDLRRIEAAILALERLALGKPRRGRPPKALHELYRQQEAARNGAGRA